MFLSLLIIFLVINKGFCSLHDGFRLLLFSQPALQLARQPFADGCIRVTNPCPNKFYPRDSFWTSWRNTWRVEPPEPSNEDIVGKKKKKSFRGLGGATSKTMCSICFENFEFFTQKCVEQNIYMMLPCTSHLPPRVGWGSLTSDYKCLRTSAPILQTRIFLASPLSAWPAA